MQSRKGLLRKRYLLGPFLSTFGAWLVGNGTILLLPLYFVERGASKADASNIGALLYVCLALGTFAPGLLPRNFFHRRALIVTAGILLVVVFLLTSRTTTLPGLVVGCGAFYLLAGIVLTQATVLTGLAAPEPERGTAMGILGTTTGLGALLGAPGLGWLADRFGFAGLWEGAAGAALLVVLGGLLSVESRLERAEPGDGAVAEADQRIPGPARPHSRQVVSMGLLLLLAAQLFLAVANAVSNTGRAFVMEEHGASKLTIDLTQSLSGAVGLCLSFILGWLSDTVGRRWVLVGSSVLVGVGLLVLGVSQEVWQFYVCASLAAFVPAFLAVGPAYVLDVVPRENGARGVSFFQAMFAVGNIAGSLVFGTAIRQLGTVPPILYSAVFPAACIVLLLLVQRRRPAA